MKHNINKTQSNMKKTQSNIKTPTLTFKQLATSRNQQSKVSSKPTYNRVTVRDGKRFKKSTQNKKNIDQKDS